MADRAYFWAIIYDDSARAEQVWHNMIALAADQDNIDLADAAVLECDRLGSYTLDHQPFPQSSSVFSGDMKSFLVALALGTPFSRSGADARLGAAWSTICGNVGINAEFSSKLKCLMRPGRSALLVVDRRGSLRNILRRIGSSGGTILKTKADLQRAWLIQSALNERSTALKDG